jgi:hypothetical protein
MQRRAPIRRGRAAKAGTVENKLVLTRTAPWRKNALCRHPCCGTLHQTAQTPPTGRPRRCHWTLPRTNTWACARARNSHQLSTWRLKIIAHTQNARAVGGIPEATADRRIAVRAHTVASAQVAAQFQRQRAVETCNARPVNSTLGIDGKHAGRRQQARTSRWRCCRSRRQHWKSCSRAIIKPLVDSTSSQFAQRGSVCRGRNVQHELRRKSPMRNAHICTIEGSLANRVTHRPDALLRPPPPIVEELWRKQTDHVTTIARRSQNVANGETQHSDRALSPSTAEQWRKSSGQHEL